MKVLIAAINGIVEGRLVGVTKVTFEREAKLNEELERSIDGCISDICALYFDLREQIFDADVAVQREEHLDDDLALLGRF